MVNDNDNFIKKKLIEKKIKFKEFKELKFLKNFKNLIFTFFPFIHHFLRFFNLDKYYNLEKDCFKNSKYFKFYLTKKDKLNTTDKLESI